MALISFAFALVTSLLNMCARTGGTADMGDIGSTQWGLPFGAYLLQSHSGKFIQYPMFPWQLVSSQEHYFSARLLGLRQ